MLGNAGDAIVVHLTLHAWAELAARFGDAPDPGDVPLLAITVDVDFCSVIGLEPVVARWGETAAAVVLAALRGGLGKVTNVFVPDHLSWVADWWADYANDYGDDEEEERVYTLGRAGEFRTSEGFVNRLARMFATAADARAALDAVPAGPARQSAAALLAMASQRDLCHAGALERIQCTEDGYESAAVLLTRDADDVVRHAYDEVQEQSINSGLTSPTHAVLLVDTSTPARLATTLRDAARMLRILVWGERLVGLLQDLGPHR